MSDDLERRLQLLEARVEALTQLTLSNTVASSLDAERTVGYAEDQRREAIDQGKHLTGIVLNDLLAQIRETLDLPEME